jgi:hypothetical protein
MRRLSEGLKQIADQQRDAQKLRRQVEQARELSEKMLQPDTPQQREEIRRLAQDIGGARGAGRDERQTPLVGKPRPEQSNPLTTPVDARQPAAPGRQPHETTVAEWYSNKPVQRDGTSTAPPDALRQAAQSAERAVEQQTIPSRYSDLVRGVFRRYSEQESAGRPAPR